MRERRGSICDRNANVACQRCMQVMSPSHVQALHTTLFAPKVPHRLQRGYLLHIRTSGIIRGVGPIRTILADLHSTVITGVLPRPY